MPELKFPSHIPPAVKSYISTLHICILYRLYSTRIGTEVATIEECMKIKGMLTLSMRPPISSKFLIKLILKYLYCMFSAKNELISKL